MRNIEKGPEPTSLEEHRCTPGADWGTYRGKAAAFAALCREQGYLCAYCMGRIQPGRAGTIEHWIARSHDAKSPYEPSVHKEHEMKWSNLLGVCPGRLVPPSQTSSSSPAGRRSRRPAELACCDRSRGNKPLHIHPAVEERPLGEVFQYLKDGRMVSEDEGARSDLEALNLNAWRHRKNRAAVIKRLQRALKSAPKGWKESNLREQLEAWTEPTAKVGKGGAQAAKGYREYCQVAVNYLEKKLRQLERRRSGGGKPRSRT